MKTSPELLQDILGVLGQMSQKMDAQAAAPKPKGDTNVKIGGVGVIGSLLGKKGAAERMAEDVNKLKKAMSGNFIKNLTNSIEKLREYNKLSAEVSKSKQASGWAHAAMDMGKALMYIAGGVASFVGVMAISAGVLGIKPLGVLGFIVGTMAVLALSMMLIAGAEFKGEIGGLFGKKLPGIEPDKNRNKTAIQNAKDMGLALMFIAGGILSFVGVIGIAGALFGVGPLGVVGIILDIVATVGLAMLLLTAFDTMGNLLGDLGAAKGTKMMGGKVTKISGGTASAVYTAKNMGIALMFIAGGILSFAITMAVVPGLLKKTNLWAAVGEIGLIIGGMVGVMALLAFTGNFLDAGIATAKGIGIAVMILSAGVFVVALTSKMLLEMFRGSKTVTDEAGKTTKEKKGPMSAIGGALAGLGVFGIFVGGLAGLLWVLGLPVISGPIALGSLALIGMAFGLIMTAKAIKKVTETMNEVGDMKKVSENIRLMVNGVLSGVIAGVMGKDQASGTGLGDIDISLKEVRQFRRVTKIIKLLGKVSSSLTKFAEGLKAFSKVGEVASLSYTYNDETGEMTPKIGEKGTVHVTEIAQSIADTFGLFLRTLVTSTEGMTRREARSLKVLGKALTGDKGIISGVSQFASTLKTFSEFGEEGSIWVPAQYEDEAQTKIRKGTGMSVPITTITKNIVDSFGEFVSQISSKAGEFEVGGRVGKKMQKFTEALMGQEKGFMRRGKPGILTGITTFNDTLVTYAEYGSQGKLPLKDKDGNIIPGKFIKIEDIAKDLVNSMVMFTSAINTELGGKNIDNISKSIDKRIGSFTSIIDSFNKLADAEEGIDKLANSIGLLATNIGSLVTNMNNLDTTKLQTLATVTAQHAITTKGVSIEEKSVRTEKTSSSISQLDWEKIGEIIGNKVAEKVNLNNSTLDFYFHDWPRGKVELKTS